MALTKDQQAALAACLEGKNVFITGGAGVGKTYLINEIIDTLKREGKNVMVTASTARAARLIGGTTCHHAFKIPLKLAWEKFPLIRPDDAICAADTVIVDEVSMLRIDAFGYLARCVKSVNAMRARAENGKQPLQLIVVGDFFQLPPVIVAPKDGRVSEKVLMDRHYGFDIGDGYAFKAPEWDSCRFNVCILREVVRQSDKTSIDALNRLRCGSLCDLQEIKVLTRKAPYESTEDVIRLCGTNRTADKINRQALSALPGTDEVYRSRIDGEVTNDDKPVPDRITLRRGARIMTVINTPDYINGSTGTVTELGDDYICVRLDGSGKEVDVIYAKWEVTDYAVGKDGRVKQVVIGQYSQIPVLPAYAVTIHRSQGQTLDRAALCIGEKRTEIFAAGQLYTGCSRVKSLENMYIDGDISLVKKLANHDVISYYASIGWETPSPSSVDTIAPVKHVKHKNKKKVQHPAQKKIIQQSEKADATDVSITVPASLQSVVLSFATVFDPHAHIDGSTVRVSSQYANIVSEYIKQF